MKDIDSLAVVETMSEDSKPGSIEPARTSGATGRYPLRQRALVLLLAVSLLASSGLGAAKIMWRIIRELPNSFSQEAPGRKFLPLKVHFSDRQTVGFIANKSAIKTTKDLERYRIDYFQAQHVLAPTIIEQGTRPSVIIASGYSPAGLKEVTETLPADVLAEFQGNVVLLKRH